MLDNVTKKQEELQGESRMSRAPHGRQFEIHSYLSDKDIVRGST